VNCGPPIRFFRSGSRRCGDFSPASSEFECGTVNPSTPRQNPSATSPLSISPRSENQNYQNDCGSNLRPRLRPPRRVSHGTSSVPSRREGQDSLGNWSILSAVIGEFWFADEGGNFDSGFRWRFGFWRGVDGVDGSHRTAGEAGEKFATASGFRLPKNRIGGPHFSGYGGRARQFLRHRRGLCTASASDSVGAITCSTTARSSPRSGRTDTPCLSSFGGCCRSTGGTRRALDLSRGKACLFYCATLDFAVRGSGAAKGAAPAMR